LLTLNCQRFPEELECTGLFKEVPLRDLTLDNLDCDRNRPHFLWYGFDEVVIGDSLEKFQKLMKPLRRGLHFLQAWMVMTTKDIIVFRTPTVEETLLLPVPICITVGMEVAY